MALVTANQLAILSLRGALGDLIFYPHPFKKGIFILKTKGTRVAPPTAGEVEGREKHKLAVKYAREAQSQAVYQRAGRATGRNPFNLAVSDFRLPPEVTAIDATAYGGVPGDQIEVEAIDLFEVASVGIQILAMTGEILEVGDAKRKGGKSTRWTYVASGAVEAGRNVVIEATARDYAGNHATRRLEHCCGERQTTVHR